MYCDVNFKSKKALRETVARGQTVGVYQPGPFSSVGLENGEVTVERPHYPRPHTGYARVRLAGGRIVSVK